MKIKTEQHCFMFTTSNEDVWLYRGEKTDIEIKSKRSITNIKHIELVSIDPTGLTVTDITN